MGKAKYWAVARGRKTGVYDNKDDALKQTKDFPSWKMQKFETLEEAKKYLRKEGLSEVGPILQASVEKKGPVKGDHSEECRREEGAPAAPDETAFPENENSLSDRAVAYCDGSWKNGVCGWGVAFTYAGERIEMSGSFAEPDEQNLCCVAGELRAAKEALALAARRRARYLDLYYDFSGVERITLCDESRLFGPFLSYRSFAEGVMQSVDVRFHKVKSHSDDPGNDRADALAKKGLSLARSA